MSIGNSNSQVKSWRVNPLVIAVGIGKTELSKRAIAPRMSMRFPAHRSDKNINRPARTSVRTRSATEIILERIPPYH